MKQASGPVPPPPKQHWQADNLASANRWAEHNLASAMKYMMEVTDAQHSRFTSNNQSLELMHAAAEEMTVSTSFTGTGGAEASLRFTEMALGHYTGKGFPAGRCVWGCEKNLECQYELLMQPDLCGCVYDDITGFIRQGFQARLRKRGQDMPYEKLRNIFAKEVMRLEAHCIRHNGPCTACRASVHAAGTECPDWSAQGTHHGPAGKRSLTWLCWLGLRRLLQEGIIYHENVGEFSLQLSQDELGDLYVIQPSLSCIICPSLHGQAYERARRLSIIIHKSLIVAPVARNLSLPSWQNFAKASERTCKFDWRVYFRCDDAAVEASEIQWASNRPKIQEDALLPPSRRPDRSALEESKFDRALNDIELNWKGLYRLLMGTGFGVASLGQDPTTRPTCTNGKLALYTIVKNPEIMYSLYHKRWMFPEEMPLVHNWPVDDLVIAEWDWVNSIEGLCSFSMDRDMFGFPPRKRNQRIAQIGNGMSLACISLGWVFIWMVKAVLASNKCSVPQVDPTCDSVLVSSLISEARRLRRLKGQPSSPPPKQQRSSLLTVVDSEHTSTTADAGNVGPSV